MNIIDEYKKIYEDEAIIESKCYTAKHTYRKNLNAAAPKDLAAVDYSKPRAANSAYVPDIIEIEQSRQEYLYWEREWKEIQAQRQRLESKIENLGDKEKKVAMYKIQGLTNEQIAENLDISTRHVYRLLKKIN